MSLVLEFRRHAVTINQTKHNHRIYTIYRAYISNLAEYIYTECPIYTDAVSGLNRSMEGKSINKIQSLEEACIFRLKYAYVPPSGHFGRSGIATTKATRLNYKAQKTTGPSPHAYKTW